MTDDIAYEQAMILFERGYRHQMKGELADAIILYQRSLDMQPTAEANTFLGWTYSMLGRYDEAIAACEAAIAVDPTYGNPYNDIGTYLIEQDQWDKAIPWFARAIAAPRYEARHYPYMNLGRVYTHLGRFKSALAAYDQALALAPHYVPAHQAKYTLLGRLN